MLSNTWSVCSGDPCLSTSQTTTVRQFNAWKTKDINCQTIIHARAESSKAVNDILSIQYLSNNRTPNIYNETWIANLQKICCLSWDWTVSIDNSKLIWEHMWWWMREKGKIGKAYWLRDCSPLLFLKKTVWGVTGHSLRKLSQKLLNCHLLYKARQSIWYVGSASCRARIIFSRSLM